jgi:hypothetical protein
MGDFFEQAARILATPMPRRRAFRLLGGVFAAAISGVALSAQAPNNCETQDGEFTCGNGRANSKCCPSNTCCAKHGNVANCCPNGSCIFPDGTCGASVNNACVGSTLCTA